MSAAAAGPGPAVERIAAGVETFARRALRGRRLAWALLAEPVDPAVEAERLVFRRAYRDAFTAAVADGIDCGELPEQDAELTAAALVGAIGEALVGPLSPTAGPRDEERAVAGLSPSASDPSPTRSPPMSAQLERTPSQTHEVSNQSAPWRATTPSAEDRVLVEALRREGAGWAEERASRSGSSPAARR